LRKNRERKNLSQSEVTMRLQLLGWDISRQVLGLVEDGRRVLGDVELFALLHVLGEKPSILDHFYQNFWDARKKSRKKSGQKR